MRLGIAQINTVAGAFDQTVEHMLAQAQRAAEQKADLVVFPLPALSGAELPSYADRPAFLADAAEAINTLAAQLPCPALVAYPLDSDDPECPYEALLIEHGSFRHLAPETRLQELEDGREELAEFTLGGMHAVVALSYADLDALADYDYDADVVIFLSGYPVALDDPSSAMAEDLGHARYALDASTSRAWLAGVSSVGGYGERVFCGASFVLDSAGTLVAALPAFEEALQVVEIGSTPSEPPAHLRFASELFDEAFHLWQAICLGIHDLVIKQGLHDVALVLDNTLASQVLLALASDALGPLHVHALIGLAAGSAASACRDLARRLRVDQSESVGQRADLDVRDLDELALAAWARELGALPLSSVDKTDLALGITASRVSAAMLLPLGDVYRSRLLDMARMRNTISPVFRKVGLSDSDAIEVALPTGDAHRVTDEQSLRQLDEILTGYIECDRPLYALVDTAPDEAFVDAILRTIRAGEMARRALPPALIMSTHTLDEARFPLGMAWHDRHIKGLDAKYDSLLQASGDIDVSEQEWSLDQDADETLAEQNGQGELERTLNMIRDLVEQGGFVPEWLGAAASQPPSGDAASPEGPSGWGSIFSEN